MNFRPSTLEEREKYYRKEFPTEKLKKWFQNRGSRPQLFAMDLGSETGIIKNPKKKDKLISFYPDNLHQLKRKLAQRLPEDIYYDRNRYRDPEQILEKLNFIQVWDTDQHLGQELAFDVDPENIDCDCEEERSGFCNDCLRKTVDYASDLVDRLKKDFGFSNIQLVYSGRGMHVHVFDEEAFGLSREERQEINQQLKPIPIDPWVSRGNIRLIRLPYSLNGLVSRIVTPVGLKEAEKFDPVTSERTVPRFLRN